MEKKLKSKPMQAIIDQLSRYNELLIIQFNQDTIINQSIDEWPICEALICFYSSGFPMDKTLEYTKKYNPIQINDLESQKILWDRREIYRILVENDIPVAKHFVVERKC